MVDVTSSDAAGSPSTCQGTFVAPILSFSIDEKSGSIPSSDAAGATATNARAGVISFTERTTSSGENSSASSAISTPALISYSRKGAPLHLSPDNVARLPLEMISLSLEHLLDYNPPKYLQAPMSMHRYLGLQNLSPGGRTGRRYNPLFAMMRDPSDSRVIVSNTEQYIAARGFRGIAKITPAQFEKYALTRPPDVLLALADETIGSGCSQKRIQKSQSRSERWLAGTVTSAQDSTNVFAPLVGGCVPAARSVYVQNLCSEPMPGTNLDKPIIDYVFGASVNLNSLIDPSPADQPLGRPTRTESQQDTIAQCLEASFESLPDRLVKSVLCPNGPHEILRLIEKHGVDLFMDEWSSWCSHLGVALDFTFPPAFEPPHDNPHPIGFNLFDETYATQFTPLPSPALASALEATYGAEALGDIPTRAYIHHLLHTHEMSAHVLLAMHNTCVMHLFMAEVRKSIQAGTFGEECRRWTAIYQEDLPALREAEVEYMRVRSERGKGRLKGLGKERIDEA